MREVCPASSEDSLLQKDAKLANKAAEFLVHGNPDAVFVYFGQVDEIGHQDGFHPSVPSYLQALQAVDAHVASLMKAIQSRPEYLAENWLVVISTDHGGRGRKHRGGHDVPEILTTFLVVSGSSIRKGLIDEPSYIVDVPVTALTHLGVLVDSAWQLDGKAVGINKVWQADCLPSLTASESIRASNFGLNDVLDSAKVSLVTVFLYELVGLLVVFGELGDTRQTRSNLWAKAPLTEALTCQFP